MQSFLTCAEDNHRVFHLRGSHELLDVFQFLVLVSKNLFMLKN